MQVTLACLVTESLFLRVPNVSRHHKRVIGPHSVCLLAVCSRSTSCLPDSDSPLLIIFSSTYFLHLFLSTQPTGFHFFHLVITSITNFSPLLNFLIPVLHISITAYSETQQFVTIALGHTKVENAKLVRLLEAEVAW